MKYAPALILTLSVVNAAPPPPSVQSTICWYVSEESSSYTGSFIAAAWVEGISASTCLEDPHSENPVCQEWNSFEECKSEVDSWNQAWNFKPCSEKASGLLKSWCHQTVGVLKSESMQQEELAPIEASSSSESTTKSEDIVDPEEWNKAEACVRNRYVDPSAHRHSSVDCGMFGVDLNGIIGRCEDPKSFVACTSIWLTGGEANGNFDTTTDDIGLDEIPVVGFDSGLLTGYEWLTTLVIERFKYLEYFPSELLGDTKRLSKFQLESSGITELKAGLFDNTPWLNFVSFKGDSMLQTMPYDIFKPLERAYQIARDVRTLDMSGCISLECLPWLPLPVTFEYMYLPDGYATLPQCPVSST